MKRIDYEIVAAQVDPILIEMAQASSPEEARYYSEKYLALLEACGWTNHEYDKETLRRVDKGWENESN